MINIGVKGRAFLLAFIPMLFTAILLSTVFIRNQLSEIEHHLSTRGSSIAKNLANASEYGVFSGNIESLRSLAEATLEEDDVLSITISDLTESILIHISKPSPTTGNEVTGLLKNIKKRVFKQAIILHTTQILDIEFEEQEKSSPNPNEIIGWIITEISPNELVKRGYIAITNTLFITSLGIGISVLLALFISRGLTIPIYRLTNTVSEIEKGHLDINVDLHSSGELGTLEQGVKSMLSKIRLTQQDLQMKVDEATSELKYSLKLVEDKNYELTDARKEALQASQTKSRFLANMSHEIRTPMNGILGFVRLLKRSKLSKEQNDYLDTIEKSANNLLGLINDILDISQVEAGKLPIKNTHFNLNKCVEDVIMLMAPAILEKNLNITYLHYTDTPNDIFAPRERISQILINFIGNAIKFSEQGTIVIRTMLSPNDNKPDSIKISISDQGIGISEQNKSQLFNSFSQIDDTNIKKYEGSGLGLAISKLLSEAMGGEVGVESEPGSGSTFWFTFQYQCKNSDVVTMERPTVFNGQYLYLYDSNNFTQMGISSDIKKTGLTVINFSKFSDLISTLKENDQCHICAISLTRNEMQNDFILKYIKEINNITNSKTLLFVSSIDPVQLIHTQQLGADSCMSKPYRQDELIKTLKYLIDSDIESPLPHTTDPSIPNNIAESTFDHGADLHGLRILVVEDNDINTKLIKTVLNKSGAVTTHANNGAEALINISNKTFDLILMDIHMPVMNGIDATKYIRASDNENSHIPIIGLTANVLSDDDKMIDDTGIDVVLTKPVVIDDLISEIKYWVQIYNNTNDNQKAEYFDESRNKENINPEPGATFNKLGIDKNLEKSLFDMLIIELPTITNRIKDSFSTHDWKSLREDIHRLLGGISYCDVPDLRKKVGRFQLSLKNQSENLEYDFEALLIEIDKLLSKQGN